MGREDRITQFEASLATAEVLPFDDGAGRLAGRINADLERTGRVIGMPDVMIAAVAIRNGLPIVTGNVTHFEQVRAVGDELTVDNWRAV
jgi:tRNA(fMet)-specific endonuclease VapC